MILIGFHVGNHGFTYQRNSLSLSAEGVLSFVIPAGVLTGKVKGFKIPRLGFYILR